MRIDAITHAHASNVQLPRETTHASNGPTFHEVFAATEGFFAAQDTDANKGMRLMADAGIFFEFIPLAEFDEARLNQSGSKAVPLADVKTGIDYAMIITTPGGLARYVLGAYILLVVYASLYPMSGWRDLGANPFAFLGAPLPRYYTAFDIFANVIGYIPVGFLIVATLRSRFGVGKTIAIATVASALLSISMEAVQTYLPSRHPSNLDVASNLLGGFAGALADAVVPG